MVDCPNAEHIVAIQHGWAALQHHAMAGVVDAGDDSGGQCRWIRRSHRAEGHDHRRRSRGKEPFNVRRQGSGRRRVDPGAGEVGAWRQIGRRRRDTR